MKKDVIMHMLLEFCVCGRPDDAFDYVYKALKLILKLQTHVWTKIMSYEDWEKENRKLYGSIGAEYFMYYFLSKKELLEHGSSLPGWLSDSGRKLLRDMKIIKKNEK